MLRRREQKLEIQKSSKPTHQHHHQGTHQPTADQHQSKLHVPQHDCHRSRRPHGYDPDSRPSHQQGCPVLRSAGSATCRPGTRAPGRRIRRSPRSPLSARALRRYPHLVLLLGCFQRRPHLDDRLAVGVSDQQDHLHRQRSSSVRPADRPEPQRPSAIAPHFWSFFSASETADPLPSGPAE